MKIRHKKHDNGIGKEKMTVGILYNWVIHLSKHIIKN